MIWGIRKVLRLQAQCAEFLIRAADALDRSVESDRHINLYSRLSGPQFHLAPGNRVVKFSGFAQRTCFTVQDEVVIVAAGAGNLRIAFADGRRLAKIKWRALDRFQLTGWNQSAVHGSVAIRIQLQNVLENVAAARSG